MVRLVGLWTAPEDKDAFEREYLGSHIPKLERLPESRGVKTSRAFDGPYFRVTEVQFDSVDDINTALAGDVGQQVLTDARTLAEKYGVRLEVLVVAEPS
jgi:uncharacterized protein (TIGR02118 family)